MALKKSDLYSSLWRSCDELRGGMDASRYKDYILTLLFVKYVTDKAKSDPASLIDVPAGGSFDDMLALGGDPEIGRKLNTVIRTLARANGLQQVIDMADFDDEEKFGRGKEMCDRLSRLVAVFADLDFRGSRVGGDDLLGDAYEYLMRHFAIESGRSKGQFYTPAEVSRVLARILGIGPRTPPDATVYDPACGSGSLLLKVADEAPHGLALHGQEKDASTWALARMNMILHGIGDADIRQGNALTAPAFTHDGRLRAFDFAVANPPFSDKAWRNGLEQDYGRFEFGMPPEKNGDYAFLLHVLASLTSTGTAAVILPHGVLFRGNAEAAIRRRLLQHGLVKGVIGLPANLFYGTGIPACVLVLDKKDAATRTGVFMIDASAGFRKDGAKNRLRAQDVHKIVDVFTTQTELARYSRLVPLAEIAEPSNDHNLNIPRYLDSAEPEDVQDLGAHLHGGIPDRDLDALGRYWAAFPGLRGTLFRAGRPGYSELAMDVADVQQAVLGSRELTGYAARVRRTVDEWFAAHRPALRGIDAQTVPHRLVAELGEDLLARFAGMPPLDPYDVYEQVMTYWHDVLHDDVCLVASRGWVAAARPRRTVEDRQRRLAEAPDLVVGAGRTAARYKADLVPPGLLVARFLAEEKARVDELGAAAEKAARAVEDHLARHAGLEGVSAETADEGPMSRALAMTRLREAEPAEDVAALRHLVDLYDDEAAAVRSARDARAALDLGVLERYALLTEHEIVSLVLDDKWHAALRARVAEEVNALAFALVRRLRELGVRYADTLDDLETASAALQQRVARHLAEMGVG